MSTSHRDKRRELSFWLGGLSAHAQEKGKATFRTSVALLPAQSTDDAIQHVSPMDKVCDNTHQRVNAEGSFTQL